MAEFAKHGVYVKVPIEEGWRETGKEPVGCRWVDINKGDEAKPNYRSRLVANEFNTGVRPEWYAATPPTECLRLLLSKLATDKGLKLMYVDVSRACFYAKAVRPVYVKLPEEDIEEGDGNRCGKLLMSMCGTRDAAQNWECEYADSMTSIGFKRGDVVPCLSNHPQLSLIVVVHGDDFTILGNECDLSGFKKSRKEEFEIKDTGRVGPNQNEIKSQYVYSTGSSSGRDRASSLKPINVTQRY